MKRSQVILIAFTLFIVGMLGYIAFVKPAPPVVTNPQPVEIEPGRTPAPDESEFLDGYTPPPGQPPAMATTSDEDIKEMLYQSVREELESIMAEIEESTSVTASATTECQLLPLGHAPCGGPAFYHVYASRNSEVERLLDLSTQHQTLAQELNRANEVTGICMITPEPVIEFQNDTCSIILE